MKIAIVHDSLIRGGAERQALYAVRELNKLGCDAELIYYNKAPWPYDALGQFGVSPTLVSKSGKRLRYPWKLAKHFRQRRFDVVHGFMAIPSVYATIAAALAGVSTIFAGQRVEYDARGVCKWIDRAVDRRVAGWIVNSMASARALEKALNLSPGRTHVVYNGIDPSSLVPKRTRDDVRSQLGIDRGAGVVAIVARLEPQKNHELFLYAAAICRAARPSCRFLIVGDGPRRAELEALSRSLGLENDAGFLGNRSDIPDILAATDISVLSSHYEGLSNVMLEAMGSGIPIVSTDYAGVDEVLTDGVDGFVVPLNDAEGLARRMVQLLDDADLRRRLGQAGRESVCRRFTLDAMGRRLLRVYESACGNVAQLT
jgi:glycosyltransferase involved in cell wall biosynthesis